MIQIIVMKMEPYIIVSLDLFDFSLSSNDL